MQAPFKPSPQMIVETLHKQSKVKQLVSFKDKLDSIRYITKATVSLPVLTIATRDGIEAELLARRRATDNLHAYETVAAAALSPETLDA